MMGLLHRPYSCQLPAGSFPQEVEVWDRAAKVEYKVASLGPSEGVPLGGVRTGPRSYEWIPEKSAKMSPFWYADKIKTPILLIHGEADDNTGTFPIQSERLYAAIRGNGGTVRLVMLPNEAHGYRGEETMEHVLYEELAWFDKYLN
jgi:pimeloyl-ACP methyl ester carboxylesterase